MTPTIHRLAGCFALAASLFAVAAQAAHYEGRLLFRGDAMPLRLELGATADGSPAAWLDLPELLMAREPMAVTGADEGLVLEFPFGIGAFTLDPDEPPERIERSLGDELMVLELTPGSPPPYARQAVEFPVAGTSLGGELYLPRGDGPHPAVLLLHGANVSGLDNWAYRSWADALARRGLAVLAFNKRRFADDGETRPADLRQLADDGIAALRWLREREGIDAGRIGLMGGSQGGWLALQVAAETGQAAFLVLTSTAAVPPWRQQLQEVEWGMRDDGLAESDIDAALSYLGLYFHVVHTGRDWDALSAAAQAAPQQPWGQYVDQPRTLDDLAWWRANCCFQPADVASRLRIPVLALFGGRDWIVPPIDNADRLPGLFPEPGGVEVHVLPGADHRLELPMGADADGRWRWPRMADDLFPVLDEWLRGNRLSP